MSSAVHDFVLQLLQSAPHSSALSLAGQSLHNDSLAVLMPLLLRFPDLTELDLAQNTLALPLPEGFDRLVAKLQRLDLSHNPGVSATGVAELLALVASLRRSTPALQHLSITPRDRDDERKALQMLPHLRSFNGLDAVDRLRQLTGADAGAGSSSATSVASPPSTAPSSSIASPSFGPSGSGAFSLPTLPALPAELPPVPSGGPLQAPEINLVGTDLEPVARLFDAVRNLVPQELLNAANPHELANASKEERALVKAARLDTFEAHINATVSTLNSTLQNAPYSSSPLLRQGAILAAKQNLFDVCAAALGALSAVSSTRGSAGLAQAWEELREHEASIRAAHEELLAYCAQELQAHQVDRARLWADMHAREQALHEAHSGWAGEKAQMVHEHQVALLRAATRENKSAHRLDTEREAAARESQVLLARIQTLEQELTGKPGGAPSSGSSGSEREKLLQRQMEEREKYWMEREAAWEMRLQAAQQGGSSSPPPPPVQPMAAQQQHHQHHQSRHSQDLRITASGSDSDAASERDPRAGTSLPSGAGAQYHPATGSSSLALHQASSTSRGAQNQSEIDQALARMNAPPSSLPAVGGPGRAMSLRQVKDLISEIYLSFDLLQRSWSAQANLRHSVDGTPESKKETLLQHMYTFLELKFGLKSLILDAAQSLLRGLAQYAQEHSVAVFAAILRHTLDYDFRHAEARTRKSVREILRAHLAARHPLKRDSALNAMLEQKVSAAGVLRQSEYSAIVGYMFPSPSDQAPILHTIRAMVLRAREAELRLAREQAVTAASRAQAEALLRQRESFLSAQQLVLPYHTFVSVLLDFQLAVQRQFLAPFVLLFRRLDTVHSGLLSPAAFARLALSLNPRLSDEDIAARLQRADAFGHGVVSFTDAVHALRDEIQRLAVRQHRAQRGLPPEEEEEHYQRRIQQGDEAAEGEQEEQGEEASLAQGGAAAAVRHHSEGEDEQQLRQHMQRQAEAQARLMPPGAAAAAPTDESQTDDQGDEYDVQPAQVRQAFHVHGQ